MNKDEPVDINRLWTPQQVSWCCVCGERILGLTKADTPWLFKIEHLKGPDGKEVDLYCHEDPCKRYVIIFGQTGNHRMLPRGPLRTKLECENQRYLELKNKGKL